MAKPEWGTKRICQSCGARFYDFARSPIVCPTCSAVFDLEILNRARRTRPAGRTAAVVAAAGAVAAAEGELPETEVEEVEDDVEVEDDAAVVEVEDDAEEDESLIEDVSELGDDEELSDVIESDLDEEAR